MLPLFQVGDLILVTIWPCKHCSSRKVKWLQSSQTVSFVLYKRSAPFVKVVPCLRWLAVGLTPRSPRFEPGSIHVGLVMDKVALGQVFLRVLRFSPVNIIPPSFYGGWTICPLVAAVQRRSLTQSKFVIYKNLSGNVQIKIYEIYSVQSLMARL
jgi:hypothetical protein